MTILIKKKVAQVFLHSDNNEIQVEAATAREAIEKLGERVPLYSKAIQDGKVRRLFSWVLNGVNILELEGLDTPLKESDVLVALHNTGFDGLFLS